MDLIRMILLLFLLFGLPIFVIVLLMIDIFEGNNIYFNIFLISFTLFIYFKTIKYILINTGDRSEN